MPPVRYVVHLVERKQYRVVVEEPSRGASRETIADLAQTMARGGTGAVAGRVWEVESVEVERRPGTSRLRASGGRIYQVLAVNASESEPDKIHEIRRGADGVVYCTCPGWIHNKVCWHMSAYQLDGSGAVTRRGRVQQTRSTYVNPTSMVPDDASPALRRARDLSRETGQPVRAIIVRG